VSTGTPRLHLLDIFSLFCFVVGLIQLTYCFLVGTFPFNSFLSGFFAAVGSGFLTSKILFFVFSSPIFPLFLLVSFYSSFTSHHCSSCPFSTVVFRRQVALCGTKKSQKMAGEVSTVQEEDDLSCSSVEQSLMEYLFCEMVLFVCVWSFIG
jgi:hypothetical protein